MNIINEKKINWNKLIIILAIAIIVAVISTLHVIVGYAKASAGMEYLWTGHYYLDFFYYLVPIAQGQRGSWISYRQYATDDSSRYPHLWPYILLGQLSNIFNLSPVFAYWLSVIVLNTAFVLLLYLAIKKILKQESFLIHLSALILFIISVPFPDYEFWYSYGSFWRRFEAIPHHILTSLLTIMILLLTAKTLAKLRDLKFKNIFFKSLIVALLCIGILSFNSYNAVPVMATVLISGFFYFIYISIINRKASLLLFLKLILFYSIITVSTLIFAKLLLDFYKTTTFLVNFKHTESNLHQNISFRVALLNIGPILLFSLLGPRLFLKNINAYKLIFFSFIIISYFLYFSPLDKILGTHNGRFLSPAYYLLLASLGILGVKQIYLFFGKFGKTISIVLFLLFVGTAIPSHMQYFQKIVSDTNINSPISYLPKGIIDGFKILDEVDVRGNVLVTPSQFFGTITPIYSRRRTYVARPIATPNYVEKNIRTSNFYLGSMSQSEAIDFLKQNQIGLIVLTSMEGYSVEPLRKYNFLHEIFRNNDIIIFKVQST